MPRLAVVVYIRAYKYRWKQFSDGKVVKCRADCKGERGVEMSRCQGSREKREASESRDAAGKEGYIIF